MIKTTVKISGMMCGMCEAHINDAIRAAIPASKVRSSHRRGEAVILSEEPIDRATLRKAIDGVGYMLLSASEEPIKKRPLLSFLGKT